MDLSTTYMGFKLPHPIVPGASPLVDNLDTVRRLEDAGAPAIVMHSLFEEQIVHDEVGMTEIIEGPEQAIAEAVTFFPKSDFALGSHEYLEQIRKIKQAVRVPVIASLNGTTRGGWLRYASQIEQAGADGLEINPYFLATDFDETADEIENRRLEILRDVKAQIRIPVAMKISPFYSSLANFAQRIEQAGADAIVLFNRFYQPDIDPEALETNRALRLSDSSELLLRLRWLAILSPRLKLSLAATGGVHTAIDAIKAVMAGAHVTKMVSALLKNGPRHLTKVRDEMAAWMEKHEYESLTQMRGSMNLQHTPNPMAYERANYMQILQSWPRQQPIL